MSVTTNPAASDRENAIRLRLCSGEALTETFQFRVERHPYRYQQDNKKTDALSDISIGTGIGLNIERSSYFLHSLFIRPHRKGISHEHNPDAPRKRNPDVITDRLT